MFTGIIQAMGQVVEIALTQKEARAVLRLKKVPVSISTGSSLAINGVCLTLIKKNKQDLTFYISQETLQCTNLGQLKKNNWVNVEFPMLASTAFSGHFVSGHVDGKAKVVKLKKIGESYEFIFSVPVALKKYLVQKGSIAIDGTSLTINRVLNNQFSVFIIPFTWKETLFSFYKTGTLVNIEVDMIARYVERLVKK